MSGFIEAVLHHSFMQNALLTGLLAGIACGIVGTYVITRRITYIAGAISHCVLGGIGAARYFQVVYHLPWLQPLYGAIVAALLAALIIGLVSLRSKQREDTVIGAIWAIGMAVGIIFISRTPGYGVELMSYLFGNILMVSSNDLWLIAILDAVVLLTTLLFYNQLQSVCFDSEFAGLRGVRVELFYLLLLGLTALTVVLLVSVVGIVLVIALITLPAAMAGNWAKNLAQMMLLAILFSVLFTTSGLAVSYAPNLPAGGTIIVLSGIAYFAALLLRRLFRRRPA